MEHNILFLSIDEYNLCYSDTGSGIPIVLLHGWGGEINSIKPIADRLNPNKYRRIIIDLPGFGESSKPSSTIGSWDYTEIIFRFISKLGLTKVHLIGHSFGGKIALLLSKKHPELVEKLIVISPSGIRLPPTLKQRCKISVAKIGKIMESYLGSVGKKLKTLIYSRISSNDYLNAGEMKNIFLRVVNEDIRKDISNLKVPTLLLWGEKDTATPVKGAEIMKESIEDVGLVVIKNAGHFSYLEKTDQIMAIINNFFEH
jgi:pimeloyl-ACP methyl ester carboxylesterase